MMTKRTKKKIKMGGPNISSTNSSFTHFTHLPSTIRRNIISYLLNDYRDLAKMRFVSKEWNIHVLPSILQEASSSSSKSNNNASSSPFFMKCCYRKTQFIQDIIHLGYIGEMCFDKQGGEIWDMPQIGRWRTQPTSFFQGVSVSDIRVLPCHNVMEVKIDHTSIPMNVNESKHFCDQLSSTSKDFQDFDKVFQKAASCGLFLPISSTNNSHQIEKYRYCEDSTTALVIVTFSVNDSSLLSVNNDIVELKAQNPNFHYQDQDQGTTFMSLFEEDINSIFRGFVVQQDENSIHDNVLIKVPMCIKLNDKEILWDFPGQLNRFRCSLEKKFHEYQNQMLISEGVAIADGIVPSTLHTALMNDIDQLVKIQQVDYHPHSNNIVRDIVHPALYSYVHGVSPIVSSSGEILASSFGSKEEGSTRKDYWGRKYEDSLKYQWLPTYFDVGSDGICSICDYINNLVPREKYSSLYTSLEQLFSHALPMLESVYSYGRVLREHLRDEGDELDFDDTPPPSIQEKYFSLKGKQLQVITKIVDYELKPGQSYEGVWHVEGMSHEEIVATAIYVLHRDDELVGADILYKRAFLREEARYFFSTVSQDRYTNIDEFAKEGLIPMGKVETLSKRLIVFPNSHIHKVSKLENILSSAVSKENIKTRRIVVFFLVNPEQRIISTREVPPQQEEAGGTMSRDEAYAHRLELMRERKYAKQDWNAREVELCEH